MSDLKALAEGPRVTTAEDAAAAATNLLSTFCNAGMFKLSERELTNRVAAVLKRIFDYDHRYSLDLFVKSMQEPELPRFLLKLATWKDQRQVRSVLQLLNSTFDPATLQRLDHADPPVALPSELIGAMKKATSSDAAFDTVKDNMQVWHAPKVGINELVPLLEKLIGLFQTERVPNMSLLNERVARVLLVNLKQHLPSSAITEDMLLVVKRYGWTEDGFLSDITFEAMGALTMELKEVLSPPATLQGLDHADPPVALQSELTGAMKKATSSDAAFDTVKDNTQIWHAPKVEINELVPLLEKLIRSLQTERVPNMSLLNERVARVLLVNLKQHLPSSAITEEMLLVVKRYGWTEDGFLSNITFEAMAALTMELSIPPSGTRSTKAAPEGITGSLQLTSFVPQVQDGMPYSEWLVDRHTPDPAEELHRYLMFLLKHRLEFPVKSRAGERVLPTGSKTSFSLRRGKKALVPSTAEGDSVPSGPIFPLHLVSQKLSASMNITARAELFRLLLDRRFLIPFITPVKSQSFHCETAALALVQTVIGEDREKGRMVDSLATNQACLRVAIISERNLGQQATQQWIKGLFQVSSLLCVDLENGFKGGACFSENPMAELGWGFLDQNVPVMILHVVGVYKRLSHFIKEFADVILADVGPCSSGLHSSSFFADKTLIEWASADPEREDEEQGEWITLRCSQADSIVKIRSFLLDDAKATIDHDEYGYNQDSTSTSSSRERLTSSKFKVPYLIHMDPYGINHLDVSAVVSRFGVARVRNEEFTLQQSFREEGLLQISLNREKLDYKRHMLQKRIREIQRNRKMDSARVAEHQLLRWFVGILRQPVPSTRVIAVRQLEKALADRSNKALVPLRESERRARILWRNSEKELDARDWGRAVEKLNSSNLNVEHLWRELSHLYVTDPRRFEFLPALAAQHLIDGFALELMDGDAAMMNVKWVMALMETLQEALQRKYGSSSTRCRLLVLSIVGPQSSGKSTLLNVMFGVRLRTSVSQTTRGVNIQLLPCHGRGNYDFVLLMDTEGLRAPENIGLEDSVWRDNRMATFAILPADATIVLTLGESTTDIDKVLPIVLSAYLDSELAQKTGGYLSPKLFFVFNQIDLSQANKMEMIVDKLLEQLKKNARIVEETRAGVSEAEGVRSKRHASESLSTRYFNDFRYDVADEKKNDVRIFGRIKHGDFPPGDTPNPEFGRRVLELREHIHRRVCRTGWEPRDLVEFGQYLGLVWKCVLASNFQFDFEDALQRMNYDVMVGRFTDILHSLSVVYGQKFDEMCRKVNKEMDGMEEKDCVRGFDQRLSEYITSLQIATEKDISELDGKIDGLFAEQRYTKWRSQFAETWTRQKQGQAIHWKRMLTEQVTNVFMYDTNVEIYKQRMRKETHKLFANGAFRNYTEGKKDLLFQQMFQSLKEEAAQKHPPMATMVERNVHEIFRSFSSLPWDPNVERREFLSSVWQTAVDFPTRVAMAMQNIFYGSMISKFYGYGHDRKWETVVTNIMVMVRALLTTVKKYSDDVVLDSLRRVAKELQAVEREAGVPLSAIQKKAFSSILLSFLVTELRYIQETWDRQNSTSVRFAACEADMRSYFNNLGQGMHAQELLVKMLQDHFTRNTMKGFEEEMAAVVGMQLKPARWVANPQVMQAYIDMDLLRMMECGEVSNMLWGIQNSVKHSRKVIAALIEDQAAKKVVTKYDSFKDILKRGLVTAATKASGAKSGRAKLFLAELKKELRDGLTSADNCLVDNLPVYDTNYDCDGQPRYIFTTDSPNIPSSIESFIPDHHRCESASLVKSILDYMRTRAYGAHDGIRPRCGVPCPICGCACIKAVGHEGDPAERLHDTYHQPIGLIGWRNTRSKQLTGRSCPVCVEDDQTFWHDGEYKKFKEFSQVFPSWEGPIVRRPLALREYIFRNYQKELVRLYPETVPCLDIPESYNHELSSIRAEIESTIA